MKTTYIRMALGLTVSASALFGAAGVGHAQEQSASTDQSGDKLGEIIVTAERRVSTVQKTALSITAIDGAVLAKTGINEFQDVLEGVPGVQLQRSSGLPQDGMSPTIAIRGLGVDGANKPPSVSTYIDDVLVAGQGALFYDVKRVEVLRGPQGTLYGGTATAGALKIVTNDPVLGDTSGQVQVDVGNYGARQFIGIANIPLADFAALRVGGNYITRHKYLDSDIWGEDQLNVRAKLLLKPTDSLSLTLGGELYHYSGNGNTDGVRILDANGKPDGVAVKQGISQMDFSKVSAHLSWDISDAVNLTSITAYQERSSDNQTINLAINEGIHTDHKQSYFTQELRLSNSGDKSTPLNWTVGLWYKRFTEDGLVEIGADPTPIIPINFTIIRVPDKIHDNQQLGIFAQATYALASNFRLTGGIRYNHETYHWTQDFCFLGMCSASVYDLTYKKTDWLARAEFDVTSNNLLYAMASTGYRSGGAAVNGVSYDSESVNAYEIGSKNRFLGGRLQINAAAYINHYPNYINSPTIYLANNVQISAIAEVPALFWGGELEAVARLSKNDTLNGSLAYSHARYTADASLDATIAGQGIIHLATDGGKVPHAPAWQANLNYDHQFVMDDGSSIDLNGAMHYQSAQAIAFDACLYDAASCTGGGLTVKDLTQDGYVTFDASLTWNSSDDRYSLTVYGRNLTNREIKQVFNRVAPYNTAELAPPRVYGIALSAKF